MLGCFVQRKNSSKWLIISAEHLFWKGSVSQNVATPNSHFQSRQCESWKCSCKIAIDDLLKCNDWSDLDNCITTNQSHNPTNNIMLTA